MIAVEHSILLDAHAVSLLAANEKAMLGWSVVAQRTGSDLYVSAVTLAEVTDGTARDARVRRVAKAVEVLPVTEGRGFEAGRLRARATGIRRKPRDLTVDALVAATAIALPRPTVVLTSDPGDLELLLAGTGVKVAKVG